jgi:hypothetical protein
MPGPIDDTLKHLTELSPEDWVVRGGWTAARATVIDADIAALLRFLAEAVGGHNTAYGSLLQREADRVDSASDGYLFHEYLEEENTPVYFYEFAERAAAAGLQFLAEAQPDPLTQPLSADANDTLRRVSVLVVRAEQ